MRVLKLLAAFLAGGGIGAFIGFYYGNKTGKEAAEKECAEEISELRDHYESLIPKEENKTGKDKVVTVASGVPKQRELNTTKTDYTSYYQSDVIKEKIKAAKEKAEKAHPSEDDIPEAEVYEINDYSNPENGEPGYGAKPGYGCVNMGYFTFDGALLVVHWGDLTDSVLKLDDNAILAEEEDLKNDILPVLKEMEFDREPLDVIKFRDHRRGCDVEVVKYACSSEEGWK